MSTTTATQDAARRAVRALHDGSVEAMSSVKILGRSLPVPRWSDEALDKVADALVDLVRAVVTEETTPQLRRVV